MATLDEVSLPDPSERRPSVLIVDDEFLIRIALSDFLQECGFKTLEATSAERAVAVLETQEFVIDVVLTDVRMPGEMNGFGLAYTFPNPLTALISLAPPGQLFVVANLVSFGLLAASGWAGYAFMRRVVPFPDPR